MSSYHSSLFSRKGGGLHPSRSSVEPGPPPPFAMSYYIKLYYIILYYITIQYIMLHDIPRDACSNSWRNTGQARWRTCAQRF